MWSISCQGNQQNFPLVFFELQQLLALCYYTWCQKCMGPTSFSPDLGRKENRYWVQCLHQSWKTKCSTEPGPDLWTHAVQNTQSSKSMSDWGGDVAQMAGPARCCCRFNSPGQREIFLPVSTFNADSYDIRTAPRCSCMDTQKYSTDYIIPQRWNVAGQVVVELKAVPCTFFVFHKTGALPP